MSWLLISVIAYFINAGIYVGDKFLLSKKIHSSIVYAFYVGIWSIFNFFILIFNPWIPNKQELLLDLSAGLLFLITLVFWYKALHQSDATRVVPIVGALTPIFSLLLSIIFFNKTLNEKQILAFLILICGGILTSIRHSRFYILKEILNSIKNKFGNILGGIHAHYRPTKRLIGNSIVSAFFFASYYVLIKYIYSQQPFIGAFVWSRLGSFIGVIIILFVPDWRKAIKNYKKHAKNPKNLGFFLFIRIMAALAFIMLNWAISLGKDIAIINALQATQYAFLILIVLFLSKKYPKILKEEFYGKVFLQKIIGIILICIGFFMLIT